MARVPTRQLPYGKHHIDDADVAAVVEALRAPLLTRGPRVQAFESKLAEYLGAEHVVAVANGTAALHLAYTALGLGPDDEIITSPVTFSATASAALMCGARVRFADVHPDTGNIDIDSIAPLITDRTRGVTAVHLGGLPADLAELRALCDRHGLWLVEDAAHALGAEYADTFAASCVWSDAATLSFHPVKHIATGEGGAVVARDPAVAARVRRLRHHGISTAAAALTRVSPGPWYYEVTEPGFNYRLSDLACALGISQLGRHRERLEARRRLARRYRDVLPAEVAVQPEPDDRKSALHLLIALIDFDALGVGRGELMRALSACGVSTQVHYIPLPHHPAYRDPAWREPPGVTAYYRRALSLPLFPEMTLADVEYVAEALAEELAPRRRARSMP